MPKNTNPTDDPIVNFEFKLTHKEQAFAKEWLMYFNKTQAAIRAGYSEKTAPQLGYETFNKPHIQAYIKHLQGNLQEATGVTASRIIKELEKIAFTNMGRFKDGWMTMKEYKELSDDDLAAIVSVDYQIRNTEFGEETIVKFKLHDKGKAIDTLNRMLGLNAVEKLEVKGISLSPEEREAEIAALLGKIGK